MKILTSGRAVKSKYEAAQSFGLRAVKHCFSSGGDTDEDGSRIPSVALGSSWHLSSSLQTNSVTCSTQTETSTSCSRVTPPRCNLLLIVFSSWILDAGHLNFKTTPRKFLQALGEVSLRLLSGGNADILR